MGISRKKQGGAAACAQLRRASRHPFRMLEAFSPLGDGNLAAYRELREALPVVDAAVAKLVRLCGGVSVRCADRAAERGLAAFLQTVPTGRGQRGIQSFLDCYLSSMLTNGMAVGEIIPRGDREIAAVVCGDVEDVCVREGRSPTEFEICTLEDGSLRPLPRQNLLLFTPLNPEPAHPYGVSLLRGMPFLAKTLLKIYESIGTNFERCGNLHYAVTYRPGEDALDRTNAAERVQKIADEWSRAMQSTKNGEIRDFVALGDVEIRTIGADCRMPDTEMPVREMLEQLVSKTGVPPFLLGLSWSSTERMSAQQTDILTSELAAYRRALDVPLRRVCDLWLAMHGCGAAYEIVWEDVNLQDAVEEAKARYYDAQSAALRRKTEEETL